MLEHTEGSMENALGHGEGVMDMVLVGGGTPYTPKLTLTTKHRGLQRPKATVKALHAPW